MRISLRRISFFLLLTLFGTAGVAGAVRIKDIAHLEGVRHNQLVGYGLVVGLNGSGDSASTRFSLQSLANMLQRLGVSVTAETIQSDNVAAVIVTAKLPPYAKAGGMIDVLVSSIGDAESLSGGTLLMTPLKGPDGEIYAVAQGPLVVGAISASGKAGKVQKNHPTVGRVPEGALVEREVGNVPVFSERLTYRLREQDFTTIARMAEIINARFGELIAEPLDGASLVVRVPGDFRKDPIHFIASLEKLDIQPDAAARIVVNERTGTIVMGEEVRIDNVAISHGSLHLVVGEQPQVSQPGPFSQGETEVVPRTEITMSEEASKLMVLDMGVSLGDVASALNAIGATPRDLVAIFQAIKAAGALHAELVVL